jgi:hypothetical protein
VDPLNILTRISHLYHNQKSKQNRTFQMSLEMSHLSMISNSRSSKRAFWISSPNSKKIFRLRISTCMSVGTAASGPCFTVHCAWLAQCQMNIKIDSLQSTRRMKRRHSKGLNWSTIKLLRLFSRSSSNLRVTQLLSLNHVQAMIRISLISFKIPCKLT